MDYFQIDRNLPYGSYRRKIIKEWFMANPDGVLAINNKWQVLLKHDVDLRKLVKLGFLKQIREPGSRYSGDSLGRKRYIGKGQTYLVRHDFKWTRRDE